MSPGNLLRFEDGAVQFRLRLIVSLLSQKTLLMKNIRSDSLIEQPGLKRYEISFLKLLDEMTNGSRIEINSTGTQLKFTPGIIIGGEQIVHDCPVGDDDYDNDNDYEKENNTNKNMNNNNNNNNNSHDATDSSYLTYRSIGWFIEGILPLLPFGKNDVSILFNGITNGICCNQNDPSVDYYKASAIPLLAKLGLVPSQDMMESISGPTITILRRGGAPKGGGQVKVYCPQIKQQISHPLDWIDVGKIKRIRGTAISCSLISSSITARIAYAAKGVFHKLLPDVWIHTDVHTKKHNFCGPSPCVTVHVSAISTTGVIMTVEDTLHQREIPEDVGRRVAVKLLQEIQHGGCVDTDLQSLALCYMCLAPEDVNRLRIGRLTPYTIESLRLYKRAFGVEFKLTPDHESKTIILSCVGTGYRNMARAST